MKILALIAFSMLVFMDLLLIRMRSGHTRSICLPAKNLFFTKKFHIQPVIFRVALNDCPIRSGP